MNESPGQQYPVQAGASQQYQAPMQHAPTYPMPNQDYYQALLGYQQSSPILSSNLRILAVIAQVLGLALFAIAAFLPFIGANGLVTKEGGNSIDGSLVSSPVFVSNNWPILALVGVGVAILAIVIAAWIRNKDDAGGRLTISILGLLAGGGTFAYAVSLYLHSGLDPVYGLGATREVGQYLLLMGAGLALVGGLLGITAFSRRHKNG